MKKVFYGATDMCKQEMYFEDTTATDSTTRRTGIAAGADALPASHST